jgi:heme/copper-type cytochrome/quinol oxidase subunit 2
MRFSRRTAVAILIGTGACLVAGPFLLRLFAQDQVPNRRELTLKARDFHFLPERLEVMQDDLVKLTLQSEDHTYSFTIDEYRVSRRIPAGGTTMLEFRADRTGTFAFYSSMTADSRHTQMRGELVVRPRPR